MCFGDIYSHAEDYVLYLKLCNYITFVCGASVLTFSDSISNLGEDRFLGVCIEFNDRQVQLMIPVSEYINYVLLVSSSFRSIHHFFTPC